MITILAKLFIKDTSDDLKIREAYGVLSGGLGIFLNIFLFILKFIAGFISGSISIMADAFNNLSDAGSSTVTLLGFRLSAKEADDDHPYGHGRFEYISALIVSGIIFLMALELLKSSVEKLFHPEMPSFGILSTIILIIAILIKLYMGFYNRSLGIKYNSASMKATATDSISDVVSTAVVLAASILSVKTGIVLDGYAGIVVALFIFYAGWSSAKETLDLLLGKAPDEEFIQSIRDIVLSYPEILDIHDLMVHDYGPGRCIVSLHAEVPATGNILELHDVIDNAESQLADSLHCIAVIHMDPVENTNEAVLKLKSQVEIVLREIDPEISFHDFRAVIGPSHTNLIFDVAVFFDFPHDNDWIRAEIAQRVQQEMGQEYQTVVTVDKKSRH